MLSGRGEDIIDLMEVPCTSETYLCADGRVYRDYVCDGQGVVFICYFVGKISKRKLK